MPTTVQVTVDCDTSPPNWPAEPRPIEGTLTDIVGIPDGTAEGNPAVALRIELPGGSYVVAQTTLRIFQAAAAALTGRYGHP